MILVYVGCFLLVLYYLFTRKYAYWQSKGVPFDKPFFIFGSLYRICLGKESFFETLGSIYRRFDSPYVGFFLFNRPSLLLRSPEVIKKVLVKDFDKFTNRKGAVNESIDPYSFHNMAASRDATWKSIRTKISPVFTSGKIKAMFPLISECGNEMKIYLNKHTGKTVKMYDVLKRYSVDVIASCAFGISSHCFRHENTDMLDTAKRLLDPDSLIRNISLFCFFLAPGLMNFFRLTFTDWKSTKYFAQVFKSVSAERKEKKVVRNDLVDILNSMKDKETANDAYKFDDIKMASQAILFFTAGNDTTTTTLNFACYEIARNKDIQDRLREEITEAFNKESAFTYETIQNMKYVEMVISETLRKYPLTNFLNREVGTNYTFVETGLTVEKGSTIFIPISGLHYDPEYFPNPEKFDPERFSDENKVNIRPYTYLPFGDGPRICIGQRFAMVVAKTALAHILKDFVLELAEANDKPMEFDARSFFLQPKNVVHLKVGKI